MVNPFGVVEVYEAAVPEGSHVVQAVYLSCDGRSDVDAGVEDSMTWVTHCRPVSWSAPWNGVWIGVFPEPVPATWVNAPGATVGWA